MIPLILDYHWVGQGFGQESKKYRRCDDFRDPASCAILLQYKYGFYSRLHIIFSGCEGTPLILSCMALLVVGKDHQIRKKI